MTILVIEGQESALRLEEMSWKHWSRDVPLLPDRIRPDEDEQSFPRFRLDVVLLLRLHALLNLRILGLNFRLADPALHHLLALAARAVRAVQRSLVAVDNALADELGARVDDELLRREAVLGVQVRRVEVACVNLLACQGRVRDVRGRGAEVCGGGT